MDRVGVFASAACLIHCLLAPLLLSLSAVGAHLLPSEEHTHRVLALAVTLLGVGSLGLNYQRHRKSSILLLAAAGLALILSGAWFGDRLPAHWCEVTITGAGSVCMIAAHRLNHTFCARCARCH